MTVSNVGTASGASGSGASSAAGMGSAGELSSRFMSLLVAQLKNQDPLNPMDSTAMTGQLAQLNSLSQLTRIGDLLEGQSSTVSSGSVSELASAASLVGKSAWIGFDADGLLGAQGGIAKIGYDLSGQTGSRFEMRVSDASTGELLQTLPLTDKVGQLTLSKLPPSSVVSIVAFDGANKSLGALDISAAAKLSMTVSSVLLDSGSVWVKGAAGELARFDQVREIS